MHTPPPDGRRSADPDEMALVPDSVARAARDWAEQQDDLLAASGQVAHAPTSGFTAPVARAAADYLRAWTEHTGTAAELSGHQAEALRAVLGTWLRTDAEAATRVRALAAYLGEQP